MAKYNLFTVPFDDLDCNALDRAALAGHVEMVNYLLQQGWLAHGLLKNNAKKLIQRWSKAVNEGNVGLADALVRIWMDNHFQRSKNPTQISALVKYTSKGRHYESYAEALNQHLAGAVMDEKGDLVKLLLGAGVNPNCKVLPQSSTELEGDMKDKSKGVRRTLIWLLIVAAHSSSEILSELLQAGADTEVRDDLGRTALLCAAQAGKVEIIATLLNESASLRARDNTGRGMLWIAV